MRGRTQRSPRCRWPRSRHPERRRQWLNPAIAYLVAVPLIAVPVAFAAPELTELSLEELLDVEVVYSASKYEQEVSDAPASISIVTSDEIEAYGYRTMAEIVASTRGFYSAYDRAYHYAGVRGVSRFGDNNSRLLLLVDGYRYNDSIYDAAGLGRDFPIDLDVIERVEIVRGPGSSIYGTSAFFGVINVVTKSGEGLDGLRVSVSTGSFDTQEADIQFGDTFENGVEVFASASVYDSGGQTHYFPEFDDPESNNGFAENADDEEATTFFVSSSYNNLIFQASSKRREKGAPTASWDSVFNDSRNRTFDHQDQIGLSFSRFIGKELEFLARVTYAEYTFEGDYVYDYSEEGEDPYRVVNKDEAYGDWWGSEMQLTKTMPAGHVLVGGVEYRDNSRQDQLNFDEEVYLDSSYSSHTLGVFAQGEFVLSKKLRLHSGLRYDRYEDLDDRVSPRLGFVYQPSRTASFKLLSGSAFRAPNVYESFYHDGGETTKAPLTLDSETIETVELVWEQQLRSGWQIALSLYENHLEKLIALTLDPEDDLLVYANLDEADVSGFEVEFAGDLPANIRSRFSYSFQDATSILSGGAINDSPRHLAKANFDRSWHDDRMRLATQLSYVSERRAPDGSVVGDNVLTNLTASLRPWNEHSRLAVSLYNLFDETYSDPAGEEHVQSEIRQDGRSIRVKLVWSL